MEALLGLSVLLAVATVKVFPVLWRPRVWPLALKYCPFSQELYLLCPLASASRHVLEISEQ